MYLHHILHATMATSIVVLPEPNSWMMHRFSPTAAHDAARLHPLVLGQASQRISLGTSGSVDRITDGEMNTQPLVRRRGSENQQ